MAIKIIFIFLSFILLNYSFAYEEVEINEVLPEAVVEKPTQDQLIFNNELDNVIAPFTYQSSLILLTGGVATYLIFRDRFEEKRDEGVIDNRKKPWREAGDILGWGALPITYGLLQYYQYSQNNKTEHIDNIEYVGKSVIYTSLATFALKLTIDQGRPKDPLRQDSFPSGHASSSFAFSTAVWLKHGWKWGLFAKTLAGWVSYSRIDDGSHFIHDSVMGAALGAAFALGIYNNHYLRDLPFIISMSPTDKLKGGRINLQLEF